MDYITFADFMAFYNQSGGKDQSGARATIWWTKMLRRQELRLPVYCRPCSRKRPLCKCVIPARHRPDKNHSPAPDTLVLDREAFLLYVESGMNGVRSQVRDRFTGLAAHVQKQLVESAE